LRTKHEKSACLVGNGVEHKPNTERIGGWRVIAGPEAQKGWDIMLIFAISLLFTAGAAFALLVIICMLTANRQAIGAALAGRGAFGAAALAGSGVVPPLAELRTRVGPIRHGRGQKLRPANNISPQRAAA
jgi:hypothetical protein